MDKNINKDLAVLPHVLIVDDDDRIRQLVSRYLGEHEFVVQSASNANDAREMIERFEYDALVVDIMMPGETGLDFVTKLRADNDIPVLFLTALGDVDDRIKGLETGADDYLVKPFEPRELILRLESILKRRPPQVSDVTTPFKVGKWVYSPEHCELKQGNETVKLTTVEDTLLRALAKRPGEVISREDLAEMCQLDGGERTIDVQVTRLRRKIEEDSKVPRYLQTVRGKGYLLRIEDI